MKKRALLLAWMHQLPVTGYRLARNLVRLDWARAIAVVCLYGLAGLAAHMSAMPPALAQSSAALSASASASSTSPTTVDTSQIGTAPLLLTVPQPATPNASQNTPPNSPQSARAKVYLSALADPGGTLTLTPSGLLKQELNGQFVPWSGQGGMVSGAGVLWLRLHLQARSQGRFMLEIAGPQRQGSTAFLQAGRDPVAQGGGGMAFLGHMALPVHRHRYLVLPLDLAGPGEYWLYVRLGAGRDVAGVPVRLWQEQAFHDYERNDYARQSGFFGLAMALTLFNLLLFLIMRDANHLWYVLLSVSLTATIAASNGLADEYLWSNGLIEHNSAALALMSVTGMALLQYARSMLASAQLRPAFDRWLKAAILMNGAVGLVVAGWPAYGALVALVLSVSALLLLALLLSGVRAGQRGAWFFLVAWLAALCAAVLVATRVAGAVGGDASVIALGTRLVVSLFASGEMQAGAALQMLLLAFALVDRFNLMRKEKEQAQKQAFDTRQILVENLRRNERLLEQRVAQRSAQLQESNDALSRANHDLDAAFQVAEATRQRAEQARQDALQSLEQLRATQSQIIQSEKTAALGQLIASVAHEINTPLGAIKCSGENIADTLGRALSNVARVFQRLGTEHLALFLRLIGRANNAPATLSSREARLAVRDLTEQLAQYEMPMARYRANILVQLNAHQDWRDYLPLWQHPESDLLVECADNMALIINNTHNIQAAVERASKTIFALKAFAQFDPDSQMGPVDVRDGIESVLQIYHNQIKHSVELVRDYEEIEPVNGMADELIQVWHNLIHNALQAMKFKGRLAIGLHKIGAEVRVSVADSGSGIEPALQQRIFEPFFTTKEIGEGSGLGLDIVKKIVARHNGRIELQSEPGQGTTFFVYLPGGMEGGAPA